jgi:hypothetical protein
METGNVSQIAKEEVDDMIEAWQNDPEQAKKQSEILLAMADPDRFKKFQDAVNPTATEDSKTTKIKEYEYGLENPAFALAQANEKDDAASEDAKLKTFKDEQDLRKEYLKQSGEYIKVRDAYTRVKNSTEDPSAAGDLSLIFNYMKMLDPGSTVREGEFASAAASGSLGQRFIAAGAKIEKGERLSPAMRDDFVNMSHKLFRGMDSQHKKRQGTYTALANRYGFSPTDIVSDLDVPQYNEGDTAGDGKYIFRNGVWEDNK